MQYKGTKSALSRRAFVGRLAAGTAAACVAGIGSAQALANRQHSSGGPIDGSANLTPDLNVALNTTGAVTEPVAAPPWEILQPLSAGAAVAPGWTVASLSAVENGACVVTLANARGRSHRVHLCRNDGRPQGLVHTEQVDLVVMNGGRGDLPTEEGLAQAVAEVAHVVAANEGRHAALVATLVPQAERSEQFAAAAKLR